MKYIHYLYLTMFAAVCCISCNDEWTDEQYKQTISFKTAPSTQGMTDIYVRYKPTGKVTYDLPLIVSGSTENATNYAVRIGLDPDTLDILNKEAYGHREELFFKQLESSYYDISETANIPAGQSTSTIPIEFTLGDLDQSDKWILPLRILDDPSYSVNPNKYYSRAMLRVNTFNDYSGTYEGNLYKIFLEPDLTDALTTDKVRTYVKDENTIFLYAGLRDIDYLDRKEYKIFIKFTDDIIDIQKKKLEVYTDNPLINLNVKADPAAQYYTMSREKDEKKPYLETITITLGVEYTFEDYTTIPGTPIKYSVSGTLTMERRLNTLIPDEDQQIQW